MTGAHDPDSQACRPGRLTGVGVGPGDPQLLTLRALSVLEEADRVVAPTTAPHLPGRAESIVRQAAPQLEIERLVFDLGASRTESHGAAARRLLPLLGEGGHVAFVTLGDPNVYSTFSSLVDALRPLAPEVEVDTVPGIMAFQELAARAGVVVLDGTERLHLVTALDDVDDVSIAAADEDAAIVVYKGGRHLRETAAALGTAGRAADAVFGELLGLEGERILPLAEAGDREPSYLATIIVPPARRGRGPAR